MLARFRSPVWLLALALVAGVHAAGDTTDLLDAVKRGDAPAVRALIGTRANVNAAEPDGTTALHWAVRAGDRPTASGSASSQTAERNRAMGCSPRVRCRASRC